MERVFLLCGFFCLHLLLICLLLEGCNWGSLLGLLWGVAGIILLSTFCWPCWFVKPAVCVCTLTTVSTYLFFITSVFLEH